MNVLRGITVALGWLSGSLAGVGAVVYVCGYLLTRAQLHVFGLSGFFPLSADHFMQEGGKFLVVLAERAIETLLAFAAFALVAAGIAFAAWLVLARRRRARSLDVAAVGARMVRPMRRAHARLPWSPACSAYLVLLALLVWLLETYRGRFAAPLEISNILHLTAPPLLDDWRQQQLIAWLLAADSPRLQAYFTDLLDAAIRAVLLLTAAWYATASLARRRLLLAPFALTVALYTLYLPMAYGVLMRPTSYNVVALHFRERGSEPPAHFFLLSGTDHEFVVWDASARAVLWVPKTEVLRADVHRVQGLFAEKGLKP
jgi:hypothetical protein